MKLILLRFQIFKELLKRQKKGQYLYFIYEALLGTERCSNEK
jgi:hypothetical protein